MAKQRKIVRTAVPGELVVDAKALGDISLREIVGSVTKPLLVGALQAKLWAFLKKNNALKPAPGETVKRRTGRTVKK
jgi:hypothetical protein